jgi:hypothetical protein
MQRVWLIRAGEAAEDIDVMRRAGLIGVRGAAADESPIVQSFVKDVKLGDLVVTPNDSRHEVWLSVVNGDHRFDPEPTIGRYGHTRTVDWLGWLDRDARFMTAQLKVIDQPAMLIELYNREWWWKHLDSKEMTAAPRLNAPTAKARATRTRTTPGPKKPPPTPRPKPVAMVLCAGQCGLQWSPAVLVGGLCPDCRGD